MDQVKRITGNSWEKRKDQKGKRKERRAGMEEGFGSKDRKGYLE